MSDLECNVMMSLYDGTYAEEHEDFATVGVVDVDEVITKLVARGMVERSCAGVAQLTNDGEYVAVDLFACGVVD